MKGASLTAASLLAGSVAGLTYEKRDNPKAVHVPFERGVPSPELKERLRLRKRQKVISETLDNFEGGSLYFANVTLGTPGQNMRFHVDTGSSDLWANTNQSPYCQQPDSAFENEGSVPCTVSGLFDPSKSSTYNELNSNFFISYADTTGASGDYATDTLSIGGANITKQQFGVALQSNSSEGVMGIGYPTLEVQVQNNGGKPYANVPERMVELGLINTPSYSLWLDDINSATGNILFGGVDTAKFTGTLTTLPIVQEQGMYVEMVVGLSSISVSGGGKTQQVDTQAIPVLLDSGSTLMYLPTAVAQDIYQAVGATYHSSQQVATCKCSLGQNTGETLSFNFAGQAITVTLAELVLQEGSSSTCLFGILPTDQAPFTLGDTFIRNAYIVYDIGANTISLAQSNFNAGSSSVHEITNGTGGIPSAVAAASPAAVTLDGTGEGINGGAPTSVAGLSAGARPAPAESLRLWSMFAGAVAAGLFLTAAL